MRYLRDPETVCAGLLVLFFFLPWFSVFGSGVPGYQFGELGGLWAAAWLVPALAILVVLVRSAGMNSTALSVVTGLLPLVGLLKLVSEFGSATFEALQIGGWMTLLAGLGLVAAALGRQAQQPATAGAEGTDASGPAGEEVEDRA